MGCQYNGRRCNDNNAIEKQNNFTVNKEVHYTIIKYNKTYSIRQISVTCTKQFL